ncbi:MAG: PKD domain-containing protein, partial [Rhodothermales bacterium]
MTFPTARLITTTARYLKMARAKRCAALLPILAIALFMCAQAEAQTRTSWQMNRGAGAISVPDAPNPGTHGDTTYYQHASVPLETDANWEPAPDGDIIGFSEASILTQCWVQVDFTYFQTFVDVPANVTVDDFAITFNGIDDGARISIYNSAYPSGTVVAGSYVFLGGAGTSDLADLIVSGEINRVVITQMDDCPTGNNLHEARVNLNGTVVQANQAPVAVAVGDATLECAGPAGTSAALDGSGSSDVDGDALTYTWTDADDNVLATGATASVLLPVGTHVITLTVDDGNGATDTDEVTVIIEDTIAPSIAISGGALTLWAPNHKYHTISLSGVVSVTDQCSGDLGTGSIASVSSDEPDETAGKKNGKGKGPR